MDQKTFVVYPGALWGWEVIAEGDDEPQVFDHRTAALAHAWTVARGAAPARVCLENWYGIVEAEWDVCGSGRLAA